LPSPSAPSNAVCVHSSIDETGKRRGPMSLGEMEAEYLQALSAYYFDGELAGWK